MRKNKFNYKKPNKKLRSVFSFRSFVTILFSVAFITTVSIMLFSHNGGVTNNIEVITANAKYTALNVLFVAVLFWFAALLYKMITVNQPIVKIVEVTEKIGRGDFSARVETNQSNILKNEYDMIGDGINQMAEELASVETMRVDFISNVSHEMKTPLTIIQNYCTILQQPDLPEEDRIQFAKEITFASKRMTGLITNMLKLNKLENQQIFSDATVFDVAEQVRRCIIDCDNLFERKNIELITDIDDEVLINGDEELTSLIWNNLISNALKFTPEGGKIFVYVKGGKNAVVTVSDTGIGMSEEETARVFEKFWQADTSHATRGNGLGLALVKKVCDVFGYKVHVESVKGLGSTFSVTIPVLSK